MTWIARSLPPETEPEPQAVFSFSASDEGGEIDRPPPDRLGALAAERADLLALVRPRIRTSRQERIRRRIAVLTREILVLQHGGAHETP